MGGWGSGRRSAAKKPRVDAHGVALRVGELRRGRALRADARGTLSWGLANKPLASIRFRSTGSALNVLYYVTERTDLPSSVTDSDNLSFFIKNGFDLRFEIETIPLARVHAGFGGMRTYFRCPGERFNRRVDTLLLAKGRFRCRRCHGLVYGSQYEDADHRMYRRATKLRARLCYEAWEPFALAPITRPKRTWRRKFWRLQDEVDEADDVADVAFVAQLRAMADRMRGSRKRRR